MITSVKSGLGKLNISFLLTCSPSCGHRIMNYSNHVWGNLCACQKCIWSLPNVYLCGTKLCLLVCEVSTSTMYIFKRDYQNALCEELLSKGKPVMSVQVHQISDCTLWVSRNLLISREIRSLLSSSMSMAFKSSYRKTVTKKNEMSEFL